MSETKEHSGGSPTGGLFKIPVEWADEQRFAVGIEHFNFESVENLEDVIREALEAGKIRALLRGFVKEEIDGARTETLCKVLGLIVKSKNPRRDALQISFAAGLMLTASETMEFFAKSLGMTKGGFYEGVKKWRRKLSLRKTRTMRDAEACDHMSLANHRQNKLA